MSSSAKEDKYVIVFLGRAGSVCGMHPQITVTTASGDLVVETLYELGENTSSVKHFGFTPKLMEIEVCPWYQSGHLFHGSLDNGPS